MNLARRTCGARVRADHQYRETVALQGTRRACERHPGRMRWGSHGVPSRFAEFAPLLPPPMGLAHEPFLSPSSGLRHPIASPSELPHSGSWIEPR